MIARMDAWFISVPVDFRLAYSRKRFARWCLVIAESEDGHRGWGCGTLYKRLPLSAHLYWRATLEPWLLAHSDLPLNRMRAQIHEAMAGEAPGVVYAVDTALWDLEARMGHQPVTTLLGGIARKQIPVTEQLFINELGDESALQAALDRGTRAFKVKVGANPDREIEQIRQLRERLGPDAEIRVDANRGLSFDEALRMARALEPMDVRVWEEPTRETSRLAEWRRESGCQVILDESLRDPNAIQGYVGEEPGVDIVNIKLARVGGLTGGLGLADRCNRLGVGIAVGCAEDLGTGMAANLALAATQPDVRETEGFGSPRVNLHTLDTGLLPLESPMRPPAGTGFGWDLTDDEVKALRKEVRSRGGVFGRGDRLQAGFLARESWNRLVQKWNTLTHRMGWG